MNHRLTGLFLTLSIHASLAIAQDSAAPIRNESTEQARLNLKLPDGGLPPAAGVQSIQVFRALRDAQDLSDGRGWTYNHHMDMAAWKGRLYIAWENGEKDEDTSPARELYSTSADGFTWSKPMELFPEGVSTPLRMYFFHAPNGRMLVIAGLRLDHERLNEDRKEGIVVREILADHTFGPVYMLRTAANVKLPPPPIYTTSTDRGFVEACNQLLANKPFLETQDYGNLLGERKMPYHNQPELRSNNFGKAFAFFHRKDGALVGIGKRSWTVVSTDEGNTWSAPVQPKTLIANMAKVWPARTSDGRFALVYNPTTSERFPLVITSGDDGVTFKDMRVVQGELPIQRYTGVNRSIGAQYVRGISEWASDGSWMDNGLWLIYSMNKEDIWVSRVPIPVPTAQTVAVNDSFDRLAAGRQVPNWNIYSPAWGGVSIAKAGDGTTSLRLEDRDPYDYARAQRVFPEATQLSARFSVMPAQTGHGSLEIDLLSAFGALRPVSITFGGDGKLMVGAGRVVGSYVAGKWNSIQIDADCRRGVFSISIDGQSRAADLPMGEKVESVHRISFRTGEYRAIGGAKPVTAGTDKPVEAAVFYVRDVVIK